ncbi:MAG: hypothetical protein WAL95_18975 [Candidatus Acidiferrales bacterium]
MKHLFAVATVLGFAICVAVPSASPKSNLASVSAVPHFMFQQQSDNKEQPQKFAGVIASLNGELFVLRDDTNNVWYHLDNQDKAGKFLGKKVLVIGTLDGRADEILIQTIEEEKG